MIEVGGIEGKRVSSTTEGGIPLAPMERCKRAKTNVNPASGTSNAHLETVGAVRGAALTDCS